MITLDLNEAADFLKMNPEVLRRKARAGHVQGEKQASAGFLSKNILQIGCPGVILILGEDCKRLTNLDKRIKTYVNLQAKRNVVDSVHRA